MLMPKGKDYRRAFDCPPYVTWAVAVSCAGIEAYVLFFLLVLEIYIPPLFVGWWYNEGMLMFFFLCVCCRMVFFISTVKVVQEMDPPPQPPSSMDSSTGSTREPYVDK